MTNWKLLAVLALIVGSVGGLVSILVYSLSGGPFLDDYGIVLDAGSSHTGMSIYSWRSDKFRATGLVNEVMSGEDRSGGIAQFVNDPLNISLRLVDMSNKLILGSIPSAEMSSSPLYLRATAGMRLLMLRDAKAGTDLLRTMTQVFGNHSSANAQSMEIMSGSDEGIFAWVATNYLLDKLEPVSEVPVAMLDMGGASSQIAYHATNSSLESNQTRAMRLYGQDYRVQSQSNLCFGADEALHRHRALLFLSNQSSDPCLPRDATVELTNEDLISNPCLWRTENRTWPVIPDKFNISGSSNASACYSLIETKLLNQTHCDVNFQHCFQRSSIDNDLDIVALSAYYFTISALNMTVDNRIPSRAEFLNETSELCSLSNADLLNRSGIVARYMNVYCFQLNYIRETLESVYSLGQNWTSRIRFMNRVKSTELGWSLGFMINATNSIPAERASEPAFTLTSFILLLLLSFAMIAVSVCLFLEHRRLNKTTSAELEPIVA